VGCVDQVVVIENFVWVIWLWSWGLGIRGRLNGIDLEDQWWQYLVQREMWTLVMMCLSPGPGA
jgi:hypothetical protein